MLAFRIDKERNVLFVNIIGVTPKDKMGDAITEFTRHCAAMRPCFSIINDMSLCKIHSIHDFTIMCKITATVLEKFEIGKIIRIINPSDPIHQGLQALDQQMHLSNVMYASNKTSALELLYRLTH